MGIGIGIGIGTDIQEKPDYWYKVVILLPKEQLIQGYLATSRGYTPIGVPE
jgi:hypothetical protein